LIFFAGAGARFVFFFGKTSSDNSSASWTFERHQSRMSFEKCFRHFLARSTIGCLACLGVRY
jgi:hypothetical protein